MPPKQTTLHFYMDNDALHQSALHGIHALDRLCAPLADQVRECAHTYIAVTSLPGGSVSSPIVIDQLKKDDNGPVPSIVPEELKCAICRVCLQTLLVSVLNY